MAIDKCNPFLKSIHVITKDTKAPVSSFLILQVLSFLSEIAVIMTSVYLPFYAYNLGANVFEVGLIGASSSITYIFMPFFAGRFSDRLGQRKSLFIGYGTLAISFILYYLITFPILFIPIRAIEGLGWSFVWPSLEALMGSGQKQLRMYNIMWGMGSILGPYIGGILLQVTLPKNIFMTISLMTVILFILCRMVPKRIQIFSHELTNVGSGSSGISSFRRSFFYYGFFYGFSSLIMITFFPIYSYARNITIVEVGNILTLMNFGRFLAFLVPNSIGNLIDRERTPFLCVILASALSFAIFYDVQVQFIYIGLFFFGLFLGLMYSIILNNTMRMAGEKKGYYAGIFESVLGIGFFAGPGVGGVIANLRINYVFVLPSIVTVSYLIIKLVNVLKTKSSKRTKNYFKE